MKTNYKEKAIEHVRSVCDELMFLTLGCKVRIIDPELQRMIGVDVFVHEDCKARGHFGYIDIAELDLQIKDNNAEIIGHTPHLEHWLRGIEIRNDYIDDFSLVGKQQLYICQSEDYDPVYYNLTKDGENQSEEFYKAYCKIAGI